MPMERVWRYEGGCWTCRMYMEEQFKVIFFGRWCNYLHVPYIFNRSSVAEWLERAGAVCEVSGSGPGWGGHKNLCNVGNLLTTSVSTGKQFHTLNTHDNKTRSTQQHSYKRLIHWHWISIRSHQNSLISSRITNSAICCMDEIKVSSYKLNMTPYRCDQGIKNRVENGG